MILEQALLDVRPGQSEAFEQAFAQAKTIIASMPGFQGLTLSRCLERLDTYLLLVQWDTLEDHTEGFRGSPQYQAWRGLLHHFYDPFPTVEHFREVTAIRAVTAASPRGAVRQAVAASTSNGASGNCCREESGR